MGSLRDIVERASAARRWTGSRPRSAGGWRTRSATWSRRRGRRSPSAGPTSPGSPARTEDELAAPLEKLAAGDARILRPVDDAPSYEIFHDVLAQPAARLAGALPRGEAAAPRRRPRHGGAAAAPRSCSRWSLYVLEPGMAREGRADDVDARFALRGDVPVDARHRDRRPRRRRAWRRSAAALTRIPRRLHARMIDTLRAAGAAVIAYDVEFREPTPRTPSLRRRSSAPGRSCCWPPRGSTARARARCSAAPASELSASVGYAGLPDRGGRRLPAGRRVGRPVRRRARGAGDAPAGELRGRRRRGSRASRRSASSGPGSTTTGPARHVPAATASRTSCAAPIRPLRGQGRRRRHLGAQAGRPAPDRGRRRPA